MKKAIYIVFSLLLLAVTLIFLITITIPWMNDPNGGLHRPLLTVLGIFTQIGVPGYFLGRAVTHDEPYKYTNEFKISMKNKDAEKFWKHRL
jgi:hypothetical protein